MYTMVYDKYNKKYSHCQSSLGRVSRSPGFFLIEFIYAFFVVTSFMLIISLFIGLSIHWQQVTSNRLLALTLAHNKLEELWLDKQHGISATTTFQDGIFTLNIHYEKKIIAQNLTINHWWVTVLWHDARDKKHTVLLETFA